MENKTETKTVAAPLTAQDIMVQIAAAGASQNISEVVRLGNMLKKFQTDIQKAEADKLQKEAEALAGIRAEVATKVFQAVRKIRDLDTMLVSTKATGFTFKVDAPDKDGVMVNYTSVALTVPTIKEKKAGSTGGGGTTGILKSQTGMSRHELVDTYATDVEKAAIQAAFDGAESRKDSARYSAEKPVIKRILVDHPELINK